MSLHIPQYPYEIGILCRYYILKTTKSLSGKMYTPQKHVVLYNDQQNSIKKV